MLSKANNKKLTHESPSWRCELRLAEHPSSELDDCYGEEYAAADFQNSEEGEYCKKKVRKKERKKERKKG